MTMSTVTQTCLKAACRRQECAPVFAVHKLEMSDQPSFTRDTIIEAVVIPAILLAKKTGSKPSFPGFCLRRVGICRLLFNLIFTLLVT